MQTTFVDEKQQGPARPHKRGNLAGWRGWLAGLHAVVAVLGFARSAEAGPKIVSAYCSTDINAQNDIKKKLESLAIFDKVDSMDVGVGAPSLMALQAYDAVLLWADTSRGCSDPNGLGNVIGQYIELGGGVVTVQPYYLGASFGSGIAGTYQTRFSLITQGSMSFFRGLSFGMKSESHPVMDGVSMLGTVGNCYYRNRVAATDLKNGGRGVATWSDGSMIAVVGSPEGHNRVDLNMTISTSDSPGGCLDPKSDGIKLVGNSLLWVANPLRATPGVVDFGDVGVATASLPVVFEVQNGGKDAITISSGAVMPMGEFTVIPVGGAMYPLTLRSGDKVAFEAVVRPSGVGRRQAVYNLVNAIPGATGLAVALTVNGIGPKYQVDPAAINFGGLPVGSMPRTQVVSISNTGGGFLALRGAPTLSDAMNFTLVNLPPTPVNLSPGARVSFEVKFNPTVERVHSATVSIPYNDGADRVGLVNLAGSYGKPRIAVPGAIIMTPVRVMQLGPEQLLTVRNDGMADLTITGTMFTGPDAGEFNVLNKPTMMMPIVVKPNGGTFDLRVQCNPTVQGIRQGVLNIASDAEGAMMATIPLQCNGVVANFDHLPLKIDFPGPQPAGQCSAPVEVVVKNSGTDALRVLSISLMGPNASSFQQPYTGGRFVPGNNGELRIPVKFCPQDIGKVSADLVLITDLSMGHTVKVPLTGTGTGPKIKVTPDSLDLGAVYIRTTSTPRIIEISNEGDQPLIFGKNLVTPPMASGPFKVLGLPADGTKLNKADPPIRLEVTVNPMMAQQYTGEIAIDINDLTKMGKLRIPMIVAGAQAEVSVAPLSLTFPPTLVGLRSAKQTVTVTNTGKAPLTGLDIKLIGMNYQDYFLDQTGVPMTPVMPGQSFQVGVELRPLKAGSPAAILVVNAAGLMSPYQVMLGGSSRVLGISCTPDEKNFGGVPQGQSKTEKFSCNSSEPMEIDYVASVAEYSDDWTIEPAMGKIAAAGPTGSDALLSLQVTLKPTAVGERGTILTIKSVDGLTLASIALDGRGSPAPKDKMMESGCSYGGSGSAPMAGLSVLGLALASLLLRRRRQAIG